jgi:hypothetical protein
LKNSEKRILGGFYQFRKVTFGGSESLVKPNENSVLKSGKNRNLILRVPKGPPKREAL